mgnify:CR=1 FL=1
MILDCFTFNNEVLLLEARLHELNSVIDYFILVESPYTQSRQPKPLYYEENKHLFKDFEHKIIHVKFNELTRGGEANWVQENAQRNYISEGINQLFKEKKIDPDYQNTWVCISDVDEQPKKEAILEATSGKYEMVSLNHLFISYFLNLWNPRPWYGTVVTRLDNLVYNTPQELRKLKDNDMPHIDNAGWHFSSIVGRDFSLLWSKYLSCIEPHSKQELFNENKELYHAQYIKHVIEDNYFWFVDNWNNKSLKLEKLPLDKLPKYVFFRQEEERFKKLLL